MALESSQRELQDYFRPHRNLKAEQGVMDAQTPGKKCHSDVASMESCKEYYMGEGGGFPRVRAVVSQVSLVLPVACPSTKGALESELTNLLVGLTQVRVSE
jgi:hypothetical protein